MIIIRIRTIEAYAVGSRPACGDGLHPSVVVERAARGFFTTGVRIWLKGRKRVLRSGCAHVAYVVPCDGEGRVIWMV